MVLVVLVLGALGLLAPGGGTASAAPSAPRLVAPRWSIGYYAGYEADEYPAGAVDWSGMTDLAVSFYLVDGDGSGHLDGRLFQGSEAEGTALAAGLISAAHEHGARALASVGGARSGPALHAAMTSHPSTLVTEVVALESQGYDGVDIDWEPLEPGDEVLLAQLGTAIRQAWPDVVLSAPLYPVNPNVDHLPDLTGVAGIYDHLDVMTYGMAYTYQGWRSWHSSALTGESGHTPTSVASSVEAYLDAGVPAAQLGVGIGAYGLCFSSPVVKPRQRLGGSTILRDDYNLQYRTIRTVYQPAMRKHYDTTAEAPYLSGNKKRCTYITYETPRSIAAKLAWAGQQGLGGVIMWTVNQQYLPGASEPDPLLATVASRWLG